jgi:hypothetical protein
VDVFTPGGINVPEWGSETIPAGASETSRANGT